MEGEGEGVALSYPKSWEARIFELTPANVWRELRSLSIPMLFIRGVSSDTFLEGAAKRVLRDLPTARVVEIADSSHFVPMEHPRKVADLIRQRVDEIARPLTMEQGKPLAEARLEVLINATFFEWYAEEANRLYGRRPGGAR